MVTWKKIWPYFTDKPLSLATSSVEHTQNESVNISNLNKLEEEKTFELNSDESLDYLGRFSNQTLQNEFVLDCLNRKSPHLFAVVSFLLFIWLATDIYVSSTYYPNDVVYRALQFASMCFLILSFGLGIRIYFHSRRNLPDKHHSFIQVAFILSINIVFVLRLLEQSVYGVRACTPEELHVKVSTTESLTLQINQTVYSLSDMSNTHSLIESNLPPCPPKLLSIQMKLVMSTIPFLLMVILYEPRLCFILLCIIDVAILFIYLLLDSYQNYLPVMVAGGVFLLLFYDLHHQRIRAFLANRRMKSMLSERERNEEINHATEMRHMIGNIAHDLKTPLSSFCTGIEVINDIILTAENEIMSGHLSENSITEALNAIQTSLSDIRNTNAFMLMTINRCLDYAKASKGMKLIPKNETISLEDVIYFPLHCVSNMQQRIGIELLPIGSEICSHIITDKQWLQENILCLLSNAVKFSTGGTVTLTVSLIDEKPMSQTTKQLCDPLRNSITLFSGDDAQMLISRDPSLGRNFSECSESPHSNENGKNSKPKRRPSYSSFHGNQKYLKFEIEDNGIGISEEAMKTLFNPFKQAQRLAGGTGLGLYSLAKRVEALKGSYGVMKRKDGGKGSLFWFAIPYRPDAAFASSLLPLFSSRSTHFPLSIVRQLSDPRNDLARKNSSSTFSTSIRGTRSTSQDFSPSLEFLLVDDAPSIIKMTTMMLKRQGYSITTAENGAIALQKLEEKWKMTGKGFDLILMDLQMPVMDGLEATRRIREMEKEGRDWMRQYGTDDLHQLIFGVSANSDHETMQDAFNAGIDDFMGKPFSIDVLKSKMKPF